MSEREDDEARIVDRRASTLPDRGEAANDPPAQDAEALTRQLAEETEKAQAYLANWQRAAADYQNYKRRVEQEREEMARLASAALIINILPILDDLERALEAAERHEEAALVDGVKLVEKSLRGALAKEGLTEIDADGTFDPHVHEAMLARPGNGAEPGSVLEVVQRGYRVGDRVVRPAKVIVAE
jgi:molecular chaperone GrpE